MYMYIHVYRVHFTFAAKTLHGCVTGLPYSRKYRLIFSWHGESVALWNFSLHKTDNFFISFMYINTCSNTKLLSGQYIYCSTKSLSLL